MAITFAQLRDAIQSLCPTGKEELTVTLLADLLGLSTKSQKQRIHRSLYDMVNSGELEKVGTGIWKPAGQKQHKRGEGYRKMWRAIYSGRSAVTVKEIVQLTGIERSSVSRYLQFLEGSGILKRSGSPGAAAYYALTSKGREQRETPYPSKDPPDPYRQEREAAAELYRILLFQNAEGVKVLRNIREQLAILNNRFTKGENHGQQEN